MPERIVIVDTGPIIAYLVDKEPRHEWAVSQFKILPAPFLTCEPVLTEVFHLLSRTHDGSAKFFELLSRGLFVVDFSISEHRSELQRLVRKYRDLPMSLADACLVRMAETHPTAAVFTLDHHFKMYRKHGRQPIPIVTP